MDPILVIVGLVVIGAVVFVMSSPRLRDTLFARWRGGQVQAANALDDATARMEAAEAETDEQLARTSSGLIEIKTETERVEAQIRTARDDSKRFTMAAENAAKAGRRDLVEAALERVAEAQAEVDRLEPLRDDLKARERKVEEARVTLETRKGKLKRQKADVRSRARVAKVSIGVNELLAGVDLGGKSKDVERALELVADLESRANAMQDVAKTATRDERIEEELAALSSPTVSVKDQADDLMARYAPATAPAAEETAPEA